MGLFSRFSHRGKSSSGNISSEIVSSVPQSRLKDFNNGDRVKCRICNQQLNVQLAETTGLRIAAERGGGTFFPIKIDSAGKMVDLTARDVQGIALRCKSCSDVFCWNCSHSKSPSCPSCGKFGEPYWFTHVPSAG
jgi:hypothetical protein